MAYPPAGIEAAYKTRRESRTELRRSQPVVLVAGCGGAIQEHHTDGHGLTLKDTACSQSAQALEQEQSTEMTNGLLLAVAVQIGDSTQAMWKQQRTR
jgi:hypothetical protein